MQSAIGSAARRVAAVATVMAVLFGTAVAAETEVVTFRLTKWKSMHFDDADKGNRHYEALTSIGCEAEKATHGDHFDVRYRCVKWKTMTLKSHDLAHQWERWLKASGFETKHSH